MTYLAQGVDPDAVTTAIDRALAGDWRAAAGYLLSAVLTAALTAALVYLRRTARERDTLSDGLAEAEVEAPVAYTAIRRHVAKAADKAGTRESLKEVKAKATKRLGERRIGPS